jgi:hypothetical protein
VCVLTRDADGNVIGRRDGEYGIDWHYEPRFVARCIVNAHLGELVPTVKRVRDDELTAPSELSLPELSAEALASLRDGVPTTTPWPADERARTRRRQQKRTGGGERRHRAKR